MTTFRCDRCSRDWPWKNTFKVCPECEMQCVSLPRASMDLEEAERLAVYARFERYYAEREVARLNADLETSRSAS